MTALTTSAKKGSKTVPPNKSGTIPASMDDSTYGKKGAKIAMPPRLHAIKFNKLAD